MTGHLIRGKVSPRKRRAELKRLKAKVADLEGRLSRIRAAVLERWCPFLPPRAGAGDPGDVPPGGDPGPVAELTDDTG